MNVKYDVCKIFKMSLIKIQMGKIMKIMHKCITQSYKYSQLTVSSGLSWQTFQGRVSL